MIGPTGEFPEGKSREEDEGGVEIAIGVNPQNNCVEIHFGTSVAWLGFGPDEAEALAQGLVKHAAEARRRRNVN